MKNTNNLPLDQMQRCQKILSIAGSKEEFILESDANFLSEFDIRCIASMVVDKSEPAHIQSPLVDHIYDISLGARFAMQDAAVKWIEDNHSKELANDLALYLDSVNS